ncbi:MAG: hypothetical protein HC854_04545 [Flavobacterium sp.]|nr:hypothetical protein [Flavobacterium sp.]
MKKITFISLLFLVSIISNAQQIIAVEDLNQYLEINGRVPNNSHIKDVNNIFSKYLGTWKTTYNNKTYSFIITKKTSTFESLNIKTDKLEIEYIITETSSGVIVEDSSQIVDSSIFGTGFNKITGGIIDYEFYFSGNNSKCGNRGTLHSRYINPTQISLSLYISGDLTPSDCGTYTPANEAIYPLTRGFILTKQ